MRIFVLICLFFVVNSLTAADKEIHREKSLYRNIIVKQNDQRRCLVFAVSSDRNQTCVDLQEPKRLVFPYTQMTLGGLLLNPNPQRILVIGLGGGSIPTALSELFPTAVIDAVEIDEAVVRIAKQFFDFAESPRLKVHVSDARVFIKRALLRKVQYDLVILDAFASDYIPEHLMTAEFLEESRSLLTAEGVLVANTFSTSTLYDHESETYQSVFGNFLNFKLPKSGNRIVIASRKGLPSDFQLKSQALNFVDRLTPYGVDIRQYPAKMSRTKDWDTSKRVLTDQYSPANLLRGEK